MRNSKVSPPSTLDLNSAFNSLTQIQVDGIKQVIFPSVFNKGTYDDRDIVLYNIDQQAETTHYSDEQIIRMRTVANLLQENTDQTNAIIYEFVESINSADIIDGGEESNEGFEHIAEVTKKCTLNLVK